MFWWNSFKYKLFETDQFFHALEENYLDVHPEELNDIKLSMKHVAEKFINFQELSNNQQKETVKELVIFSQFLEFVEEKYSHNTSKFFQTNDDLKMKLKLMSSSNQFIGKIDDIQMYCLLEVSRNNLTQGTENFAEFSDQLSFIRENIGDIHAVHTEEVSTILGGLPSPMDCYCQLDKILYDVEFIQNLSMSYLEDIYHRSLNNPNELNVEEECNVGISVIGGAALYVFLMMLMLLFRRFL
ncbi:hypothetical protein PGTUg99_037208 [Puccinia graminis f. sp. tritici]|uniref:Uncharacterized protein n=1 Tax=Puccinia graminis f. sp. tritici TaxID=56615 RepID=A0A5B0MHR7_PUCGR|nr:hypothetical protein PGTUg99_037208 [Puccinia graminis f. sp. tritici]